MAQPSLFKEVSTDSELEHKARRVADKYSETVNIIANEPSLAFFRIQEHVRKTLPQLVDQKHEVEDIQAKVQGACFDTDYASNAVKAMLSSAIHFENIQDLLKNAMFMKQQINYEDGRRKYGKPTSSATFPPSDRSKETDNRADNNSGSMPGSELSTDSSPDTSGSLRNESLTLPKTLLEDSDEGTEVEQFMSSQTIQPGTSEVAE
jgi:hypothetical protein